MEQSAANYSSWGQSLTGGSPRLIEDEPWCGYFKMRDRRGLNINLAPIKRPFIACAIWAEGSGELKAELAGAIVPVERIWPWCAKHPIDYQTYVFWHENNQWPEEVK